MEALLLSKTYVLSFRDGYNNRKQRYWCVISYRVGLRCLGTVPDIKLPDFPAKNEPVLTYLKGSKERKEIEAAIKKTASQVEEVPIVIGDKDYKSDDVRYQVMPHNHKHKIAKFYYANADLLKKAIDVAVDAQKKWDRVPLSKRLIRFYLYRMKYIFDLVDF